MSAILGHPQQNVLGVAATVSPGRRLRMVSPEFIGRFAVTFWNSLMVL